MKRTILGYLLVVAGLAGWFLLPDRGELVVIVAVIVGAFMISAEQTGRALRALSDFFTRKGA